ncbi:hypothetical protein SCLCIDRAFT_1114364 [Scleroderma citrinum Foug A]|uniref:Uncharacterized protein n=1 Tax=Scleroderma citrinum Foug A TaxID=1036808 RepID=A0A0C3DNY4_9AGAM|nr:hypothetical protein SCLCIDRAFT_1114364 [Scleroderma citrinum Foug A]
MWPENGQGYIQQNNCSLSRCESAASFPKIPALLSILYDLTYTRCEMVTSWISVANKWVDSTQDIHRSLGAYLTDRLASLLLPYELLCHVQPMAHRNQV